MPFEQLSAVVELFSKEEDSIVAMVPHFHQVGMMLHIYILHQRKTAEHDILQDYILEKLS